MDSRAAPPPLGTDPPQAATVPALPPRGATSVTARRYYGGRNRGQLGPREEREGGGPAVDLPRDQSAPLLGRQSGSDHLPAPAHAAWADAASTQRPSVLPGLQQAVEVTGHGCDRAWRVASGPSYAAPYRSAGADTAPNSGPGPIAMAPSPPAAAPESDPVLAQREWQDAALAPAPESFAGGAGASSQRVGFASMPRADSSVHAQSRVRRRWATSRLGGRPVEMEEEFGARLRPVTTTGDPAVYAAGDRVNSSGGEERDALTPFSSSSRPHTASTRSQTPHDDMRARGDGPRALGVATAGSGSHPTRAHTPAADAAGDRERRHSQRPVLPLVQAARQSAHRRGRDASPEGGKARATPATAPRTPALSRRSLIQVPVRRVSAPTCVTTARGWQHVLQQHACTLLPSFPRPSPLPPAAAAT